MTDPSTFRTKNKWQRAQRDAILKPFFYDRYFPNRYRFLDSDDPTQRQFDTIVETADGTITVEEKIVHWPSKDGVQRDHAYDAFALETWTCTVPGFERQGWMHTSVAHVLLYGFSIPQSEVGLDCWVMRMQPLKKWFWDIGEDAWAPTRTNEPNRTECRVVPIADVIAGGISTRRFKIGPGWPDSHFCKECCADASFGYNVNLRADKFGVWYCREHRPTGGNNG